nr:uncharacterized protein LOC119185584 [Rhipicephalus microplus]
MREKHVLTTFLLVVFIVALVCGMVLWKHVPSMRDFVNTTEIIWTYYTSEPTKIECKADKKLYLSLLSIEFQRSYYYKMKKMCYSLVGRFHPKHNDVMIIHSPGSTFKQTESIEYLDGMLACAVVKVTMPGSSELRCVDAFINAEM